MKVLILMTGHQQNLEYKYFGQLLSKCALLSSENCDIFIHSNKVNNDISKNAEYIKNKKTIHITDKNLGYTLGGIEAVHDSIELLNLVKNTEYDYVIHIHPDVFIINDSELVKLMNDELNTTNVFFVNRSFDDKRSYSFDFFMFKPKLLETNIFKGYESWTDSPERFIRNALLLHGVEHIIIKRYHNDNYEPRRIDLNYMWHEHNLNKIKKYIEHNK